MLFYHATQTSKTRTWDKYTFPVFGLIACGLGSVFLTPFLPLPDAAAKVTNIQNACGDATPKLDQQVHNVGAACGGRRG